MITSKPVLIPLMRNSVKYRQPGFYVCCLRLDHFLSCAAEKETLNGAPSYLINFWGIKSNDKVSISTNLGHGFS